MSKKILLIVDDSKVSRMMLSMKIKEIKPNVDIIEAKDGDEAIEKTKGKHIDYFSIDLNMPGLNGLEVIERLKPDFPEAKFALFTANIQDGTQKKAEALDACCVHKPIGEESINKLLGYFDA